MISNSHYLRGLTAEFRALLLCLLLFRFFKPKLFVNEDRMCNNRWLQNVQEFSYICAKSPRQIPVVVAFLCFVFLFMQTKYMHRIKFIICSRCGNVLPLIRYVAELRPNDLAFLTECLLQCTRIGTNKIRHTSQKTTPHRWNKKV